jgi:hypothetical protein
MAKKKRRKPIATPVKLDKKRRKTFEEALASIVRRAGRLKAALEGSADIKRVPVGKATVPEHTREAHYRYIIVRRRKK